MPLTSQVLDIDYEVDSELIVSISQDKTMRFWRQEGAKAVLAEPWFMEWQSLKCPDDAFGRYLNTKEKTTKSRIASNHFTAVAFKQDEIDTKQLIAGDLLGKDIP